VTGYDATIDWDDYWADADEAATERASPAGHHATDVLSAFVTETGAESVADVGCGAGAATVPVAEAHPDVTVVGYDAAAPVVERNEARTDLPNLAFEVGRLPAFEPGRQFDVVFCYFTLPYVRDVDRALKALYDAVAPGGSLVCNYATPAAREFLQVAADDPHAHADRPLVFDPDSYTERWAAVLEGDSALTPERVEATLGREPESVFETVERPDVEWAWHHFPLVRVPKPT
jgi:trans-aconitate methyltransferase